MPTESIIIVSAILMAFTTFAAMLAWVDHYARGYRSGPHHDPAAEPAASRVKAEGAAFASKARRIKHAGKPAYVLDAKPPVSPANDADGKSRAAQA